MTKKSFYYEYFSFFVLGEELSCYSCSSTTIDQSQSTDKCKNPTVQRCGKSRMTGLVQDRCMTIMVKAGSVAQQLRNCSDAVYCTGNNYCKSANQTAKGTLTKCKVSCCYGNLCNNGMTSGLTPATSVVTELLMATLSTRLNNTVESRVISRGNVHSFLLETVLIALMTLSAILNY